MEWMTTAVDALMRRIDAEKDYGLFPILCDALEDAGYPDQGVIASLRAGPDHLHGPWYRRLLEGAATSEDLRRAVAFVDLQANILADQEADHYAYWGRVSDEEPKTRQWLLDLCARVAADPEADWTSPARHPGTLDGGDEVREMWKHYATLTGVVVTEETWESADGTKWSYPRVLTTCGC